MGPPIASVCLTILIIEPQYTRCFNLPKTDSKQVPFCSDCLLRDPQHHIAASNRNFVKQDQLLSFTGVGK